MKPELLGLSTYFLCWAVAALLGVSLGLRAARAEGVPGARAVLVIGCLVLLVLIGAKGMSTLEYLLFPIDRVGLPAGTVFGPWQRGFQVPGGGVLLVLGLFPLCWMLGLPALRLGDAFLPIFGLVTAAARFGCFLNGCCWGTLCDLPWALRFPRGSRVFIWQLHEGLIGGPIQHSLPVHPLQLYFVGLGLAVFGLGVVLRRRRRFEGQVWLACGLLYFGGTLAMELLRVPRVHVNLIFSAVLCLGMGLCLPWLRNRSRAAARVRS